MKRKPDFILRNIAGSNVIVPVGDAAIDFNGIININETGAFVWNLLENDISREAIAQKLLDEYDTDEQTAKRDVDTFLGKLKAADLLTD